MKIEMKVWHLAVIIFFIGLGVYMAVNGRVRPFPPVSHADTTYVYDTVRYEIYDTLPYPVPVPVRVVDTLTYAFYDTLTTYDTIPIAQSTEDIIKDYYRVRYYSDTISDDNIDFYVREQIGANRILNRSTSYVIKRPYKIITQRPDYIYVGGILSKDMIAPAVTYSNHRWQASLGYDPINKTPVVSGGVKVLSW